MLRITGDIWEIPDPSAFIVIPVNLEGVCGRGLARQMVDRWPGIGTFLRAEGKSGCLAKTYQKSDILQFFAPDDRHRLVVFPVKSSWRDQASMDLIKSSCDKLNRLLESVQSPYSCRLPLVGCGFGELTEQDVLPVLESVLTSPRCVLVTPDPAVFNRYPSSFVPGVRADKTPIRANINEPPTQG